MHITEPVPPTSLHNIGCLDCFQKKGYILLLCAINLKTMGRSVKEILERKHEECKYEQPLIHVQIYRKSFLFIRSLSSIFMHFPQLWSYQSLCCYTRFKITLFIFIKRCLFLSLFRRNQKGCVSTMTCSLTWRATPQSTICAVRSLPSTTPPENSGENWSKLEGWGRLTCWLLARLTGLMAK